MNDPKVIVPYGQLAGRTATAPEAVQSVCRGLLTESVSGKNRLEQALSIRRTMLALWLVEWQLHTPQEKYTGRKSIEEVQALVDTFGLKLPSDLQSLYNHYRNSFKPK